MRSSVSVILSSPSPDPNMSYIDYEQTAYHHSAILILVRHLGEELSANHFSNLYDRISKVNSVKILDSNGVSRCIHARFVKDYPVGNNDWGDFQTHRRLLGLITIGKCKTQIELNEICRVHETLKVKYTNTLYDSRCIIFGVNDGPDVPTLNTPSIFKSRALFYATEGSEVVALEDHLSEFLSSLFWVLESKRHERSREKIERVSLLVAPFEKKDFVGLDMESRSSRKRSVGRMTKHLGDLCLQSGLAFDALTHYHAAVDHLRSINDWLWLGSACEGLSAASVCIRYPYVTQSSRKSKSLEGTPTKSSSIPSNSGDNDTQFNLPPQAKVLSPDDICKHYRESIVHYSKYQNAGVIEAEACFKAARVAIEFKFTLPASNFLQNTIFINIVLPEEDKIQRLLCIADLYSKIGFERKVSFYRRLAATRFVSARNPQTNWEQCYHLMLQSLPGHKLTLDPNNFPTHTAVGWGRLQKQVLQDLVAAARRVGHSGLATRHMTLLLQVMWRELTPAERNECAHQLQTLTEQCEGSPVSLVLDSGVVIPPANLIHIPLAESFTVTKLKPQYLPSKLEKTKEDYGPFLFSPLNFGSLERKIVKKENKQSYVWVAEEPCEVKLELTNPLPFELEVSNMMLLTNGVVFESIPVTVTLPPEMVKYPVALRGTPKEVGELEIIGYSTHTLGVKSDCKLNSLPKIPTTQITIDVVPSLPFIQASVKIPEYCRSDASSINLYAGETVECELLIDNVGSTDVEIMEITVDSFADSSTIEVDISQLQTKLPLKESSSVNLPVRIFALSSFISALNAECSRSSIFSGPSSFPSLSSSRAGGGGQFSPDASFLSGPSSLNSLNSNLHRLTVSSSSAKGFECRLKIRYSGKPGLSSGYCRTTFVLLNLNIDHSILITNWDVLPSEISTQFYLVLDIVNMTNQEMVVRYTSSKMVLMEENESCRVPVPVDRCPLSKIAHYFQSAESIKGIIELSNTCCNHIASLVEIEWEMGNRKGKASLDGITLSVQMLDIVRMSPISWEVKVNNEVASGTGSVIPISLGKCVQLSVQAKNSLSWPLKSVDLNVQLFQDHQNGTCNYHMETRLATAGPSRSYLPMVEEFGVANHEVSIVFFSPGQYKVNVQCSSEGRHCWRLLPPVEIEVKE